MSRPSLRTHFVFWFFCNSWRFYEIGWAWNLTMKDVLHWHTGCTKKRFLRTCVIFLFLKILPLALALIKTKNCHLFDPLVRKCPFSFSGNCLWPLQTQNFQVKWVFSDQCAMGQFFVLIYARANSNIFRAKKITNFLKKRFFVHPVCYISRNVDKWGIVTKWKNFLILDGPSFYFNM